MPHLRTGGKSAQNKLREKMPRQPPGIEPKACIILVQCKNLVIVYTSDDEATNETTVLSLFCQLPESHILPPLAGAVGEEHGLREHKVQPLRYPVHAQRPVSGSHGQSLVGER